MSPTSRRTLTNLAQFMMHSVWVRYTETRFLWTPKDNGVALFAVGMSAAIVQGGLLSLLIKKLGEVRLAKVGLLFAAMQFILMGLAPQGFYIYIILLVTILASAAGPALQAHVSRAVPAVTSRPVACASAGPSASTAAASVRGLVQMCGSSAPGACSSA